MNWLVLSDPTNHSSENTTPSLKASTMLCGSLSWSQSHLQTCAEFSAALIYDYPISQISSHPEYTSITAGAFRSTWEWSCTKALCSAQWEPGSIWNCTTVLVSMTTDAGRFVYGFRTILHFADGNCHEHDNEPQSQCRRSRILHGYRLSLCLDYQGEVNTHPA